MTDHTEFVTEIAKRESIYRLGIEYVLPHWLDGDKSIVEWWRGISHKTSFTFPNLKSEGVNLFYKLCDAIKRKDREEAEDIVEKIKPYIIKNYKDKKLSEKWDHFAVQLPEDWGPVFRKKEKLKTIMTKLGRGRILEAMCGFTSYFQVSEKIEEVIALDFSRKALERYDYPTRKRILYDLRKIIRGDRMNFFPDGYFNTIGVCFGIDYLKDPVTVYKEFHRILSNDGKLLVVGGTTQGYEDMLERSFDPENCANSMRATNFSVRIKELPVKTKGYEVGEYFLVEGKK